jgi:hypothetical protein
VQDGRARRLHLVDQERRGSDDPAQLGTCAEQLAQRRDIGHLE